MKKKILKDFAFLCQPVI